MPLAFAIQCAGVDAEDRGGFLNRRRTGEDAADVFGFKLIERQRATDFRRALRHRSPTWAGRSARPTSEPVARITPRSIAFRSSRTLPGHGYLRSAFRASSVSVHFPLP